MQGRIYTASFESKAFSSEQDLFELVPADDKPIEIIGLFLGQSSDFGDAQAEILPYKVSRGFTVAGSGGAAVTPSPLDAADVAAGFTCNRNNTTGAGTGTEVILHADTFNVAVGEKLWLPEGCGWHCNQGQSRMVVRINKVPADALTFSGTLYVKEYS